MPLFGIHAERESSYVLFQIAEIPTLVELEVGLEQVPSLFASAPAGEFVEFRFDPERGARGDPIVASPEVAEHPRKALLARRDAGADLRL